MIWGLPFVRVWCFTTLHVTSNFDLRFLYNLFHNILSLLHIASNVFALYAIDNWRNDYLLSNNSKAWKKNTNARIADQSLILQTSCPSIQIQFTIVPKVYYNLIFTHSLFVCLEIFLTCEHVDTRREMFWTWSIYENHCFIQGEFENIR